MKEVLILAVEDAQARLLAPGEEGLALLLQGGLVLVVVLHGRDAVVEGDVEVVVEVGAEGRHPGEGPAHAPLEGVDLGERRARHDHEGGVAREQVREVGDVVGEEGAAGAAFVLVGAQHEVVHDELLPAVKEVEEGDLSGGALEGVLLLEVDHWEVAHLGV